MKRVWFCFWLMAQLVGSSASGQGVPDINSDLAVDLYDLSVFQNVFQNSAGTAIGDFDGNNIVDLLDYQRFATALTGPNNCTSAGDVGLADTLRFARELGFGNPSVAFSCTVTPENFLTAGLAGPPGQMIGLIAPSPTTTAFPALLVRSSSDVLELFNRGGGLAFDYTNPDDPVITVIASQSVVAFDDTGCAASNDAFWLCMRNLYLAQGQCRWCARLTPICLRGARTPYTIAACLAGLLGTCGPCFAATAPTCNAQAVPVGAPCDVNSVCSSDGFCVFGACLPYAITIPGFDCTAEAEARSGQPIPRCRGTRTLVQSAQCDGFFGFCDEFEVDCGVCQTCDPGSISCVSDDARNGQLCLDGALLGKCCGGRCVPSDQCCADDVPCTRVEWVPGVGCTKVPDDSLCDDGVACTRDECVEGWCEFVPDDLLCNPGATDRGNDPDADCLWNVCSPTAGCLPGGNERPGAPCDDGIACTYGDRCHCNLTGECYCTGWAANWLCPEQDFCDDDCATFCCDLFIGCVECSEGRWGRCIDPKYPIPGYPYGCCGGPPGEECIGASECAALCPP